MSTAYALVTSTDTNRSVAGFVAKVNDMLANGWKLHGPTMHAISSNVGTDTFSQAFTKDYPPDPTAHD